MEWYGVIPDHWGAQRFKHLATIRNGQVDPEDPRYRDLPLFAPNHIESGTGRIVGIESADEQGAESGKYLVRQGEIVYSKIRPALRKAALAPCDGLCSADMYPVAPRGHADAGFLLFEMLSEGFSRYSLLESDRVAMPKINREALGECPFVFPDLPHQKAVAAFLGRKTEAIDSLIQKKERQIELLREKRQALITQAVTKGLDPKVPMKDSGVEWLGEIPGHWTVSKLSRLLTESPRNGISPPVGGGSVPSFSIAAMRDGTLNIADNIKYVALDEKAARPYRVRKGDVFVMRGSGSIELAASAGLVREEPPNGCTYPDTLIRLRLGPNLRHAFAVAVLNSPPVRAQLETSMRTAAGIWKISGDRLSAIQVPVPPVSDQLGVEAAIGAASNWDRAVTARVKEEVDRLREYRQALISAAVTGKIEIPTEEVA